MFGVLFLLRRRRKTRWPFKADDQLLRGPGESLKRQIAKLDEQFAIEFFAGVIVAVGGYDLIGWTISPLFGLNDQTSLFASVAGLVTCIAVSMVRIARVWSERSNHFLGWYGERYVAENLEPMRAVGWLIFHDVPATGSRKPFNLDHVVVGNRGVAVIETKTRRKGAVTPGSKDYVVFYDGQRLIWPWGEDRHGLEQAVAEADWLRDWIRQVTGIETPVIPILALPGWWVESKVRGSVVSVVNPKNIARAIEDRAGGNLTDQQVNAIARQLDNLCRDVED